MLFIRYCINGLVATLVHYTMLTVNIRWLGWHSAAMANGVAACFGIGTSYLGSRRFVFRSRKPLTPEFLSFSGLYLAIGLLHAGVLYLWTDQGGGDYRLGFLFATGLQLILSFVGNRWLVFRR